MARIYYDQVVDYIITNQDKFYRLAFTYIKTQEGALDAVQNAIVRALEKYDTIRDISAIRTWFYKILVNECLMYIRKRDKEIPVTTEEWNEIFKGIYIESAFEPGSEVIKKLDQLGPETKTVILLYYFEGLTLKEISEVTQTNINTVKSRMYSGLRKLKGILKAEQ